MLPAVLLSLAALRPLHAPVPPGEAVVRQAYQKYSGKWFRSALYIQRTVFPMERRMETWYVALQTPGLMRVDVAPPNTGRAVIYRNDSTYEIGGGNLRSAAPGILPMLTLMHDLHSAPPAKIIAMLHQYGFDLSKTHTTTWDGKPAIVVGALEGDTVSNQFWLDRERMVLVRLIERNTDPRRPLDARLSGYKRAGAGWLERTVRVYLGGQLTLAEDYSEPKIDLPLERGLFEPTPYRLPQWVGEEKDIFGHVPNMKLGPP